MLNPLNKMFRRKPSSNNNSSRKLKHGSSPTYVRASERKPLTGAERAWLRSVVNDTAWETVKANLFALSPPFSTGTQEERARAHDVMHGFEMAIIALEHLSHEPEAELPPETFEETTIQYEQPSKNHE